MYKFIEPRIPPKIFPDANVKQRYNELKKLESVTDELMNTTFNNKSNIANMSANDMFQYLTTNTTSVNLDGINISKPTPLSGALQDADAKNDITSIINKDMFFNNAVTRKGLEDMLNKYSKYKKETRDRANSSLGIS